MPFPFMCVLPSFSALSVYVYTKKFFYSDFRESRRQRSNLLIVPSLSELSLCISGFLDCMTVLQNLRLYFVNEQRPGCRSSGVQTSLILVSSRETSVSTYLQK